MWTLLFGFASFVCLVVSLFGFRRYNTVLGWAGMIGFISCLLVAIVVLWMS